MSIKNSDSGKHKICTKDSTETEGVSVSNYIVKIEWFGDFLRGQGEKITTTTLLQDNASCIMILEDPSRGKLRTRNIKARFGMAHEYLVLDKGARIEHLKTDLMLADAMTKPLAHPAFKVFASRLLNHITWEEMVRRVRPEADDREVRKAMGSQWADGATGNKVTVKTSDKSTTKKVSNAKNEQQGSKAVSWDRNLKIDSTSTCYAPLRKKSAGGNGPKVAGKGILRSITPTKDRTGGWGKGRGKSGRRRHGYDSEGVEVAPQLSRNRGGRLGKPGNGSLGEK